MSATNRGFTIRNASDFYPTPESAFLPLIPYIPFTPVWEPACGDRRLIQWMVTNSIPANGDDLNNGYDFLQDNEPKACIVTNPPFSLALEFVQHALKLSPHVFMLLRLNFLASRSRQSFWQANEPSALFVLSKRPSFTGKGTDATDYAWFYWGNRHSGIFHL